MAVILAVHAHPDDLETLATGTLTLLARGGHRVIMATLTAGECGAVVDDPAATARIRMAEAQAAAGLIGAAYDCLGLPDLGVFNDDPSRRAVTELIRRWRPDIVIGPTPSDYHPDHEAGGLLVRDACFAASAPGYRTGPADPLTAIPHLYCVDPINARERDGSRAPADFAVDVGAVMEVRRAMLLKHQSQVEWLARQHAMHDFTAAMEAQARRRGRDFGVEFAEAFRQYKGTPYPRDGALQALLGEALLTPPPA